MKAVLALKAKINIKGLLTAKEIMCNNKSMKSATLCCFETKQPKRHNSVPFIIVKEMHNYVLFMYQNCSSKYHKLSRDSICLSLTMYPYKSTETV